MEFDLTPAPQALIATAKNVASLPEKAIDAVLVHAALGLEQWEAAAARLDPLVPLIALGQPPRHLQADAICPEHSAPALDNALASLAPRQLYT